MAIKLVPIREYPWGNDLSYQRTMTCTNHPTARYSSKNPFERSVFITRLADGMDSDCGCPFELMAVVTEE